MKLYHLTIKKNMAKVNVFFRQTDRQTDRQTGQKLYAIDLSMWGYKKKQKIELFERELECLLQIL